MKIAFVGAGHPLIRPESTLIIVFKFILEFNLIRK